MEIESQIFVEAEPSAQVETGLDIHVEAEPSAHVEVAPQVRAELSTREMGT